MRPAARLAAGCAALVLAGCGSAPVVTRATPGGSSEATVTAPHPAASPADLPARKKAAGIADCPASDAGLPAVPGGLPDVTLRCLGGGRDVRLAGLRGRPMMINLWAQWCAPCREEAPYIAEVARQNRAELMILGVDYADPRPDLAIEFAQLVGWTFPQLVDDELRVRAPLQISGPPVTFFVTADGVIAYRHSGPFDSAEQIRELAARHLGVRW